MSATRSRNTLHQAEQAFNEGDKLDALILGILAIGWMLDDINADMAEINYKGVDYKVKEKEK